MKRFASKTAVVTGGNSGIGRAAALQFAQEGARVAILARTAATGREVVDEIRAFGGDAAFFQVDVAQPDQVRAAMNGVLERFGSFEVAFNCSGTSGEGKPFHQLDEAEFDQVLKTNLYGVFHCMKHEIDHFISRGGGGAIVNCASTSGLVGLPALAAYNASKHAVVGLTKSVALDYGRQGIRVNAVCPGGVLTPMLAEYMEKNPQLLAGINAAHPIGRMARPEEVTGLVLWLCSEEASNVIGQAYAVDGGYTTQ
jgi:NAD(P)-dependent dehydrogenase (short-subunit alcohol dehydrogenase family)